MCTCTHTHVTGTHILVHTYICMDRHTACSWYHWHQHDQPSLDSLLRLTRSARHPSSAAPSSENSLSHFQFTSVPKKVACTVISCFPGVGWTKKTALEKDGCFHWGRHSQPEAAPQTVPCSLGAMPSAQLLEFLVGTCWVLGKQVFAGYSYASAVLLHRGPCFSTVQLSSSWRAISCRWILETLPSHLDLCFILLLWNPKITQ